MSFEIQEVSNTRPPKPDPFEGLAKVLEGMEIGSSKTVHLRTHTAEEKEDLDADVHSEVVAEVNNKTGKEAIAALRRYAERQGVGVRLPGFATEGDGIDLWWTKKTKRVVHYQVGSMDERQVTGELPYKNKKKAAG